ncbi:hypothetical protein ACIRBY_09730 [Streptomyces sp. NPDC096136]|uniref:hypothetical protein n=1 Tax=Streptomyces sp. NPDC096136 TaxID=3366076 RepID=UPI0038000656
MTSHIANSCPREALSVETSDNSSARVTVIDTPGTCLLTRAHAGWERFLGTFEEPPHE